MNAGPPHLSAKLDPGPPAAAAFDRLMRLQIITSALVSAPTSEAIGQTLTRSVLSTIGARSATLSRLEAASLRVVACHPMQIPDFGDFATVDLQASVPTAEALRRGAAVWLGTPAEIDARYPSLASLRRSLGDEAWALIPLHVGDRKLGVLGLSFATAQVFDEDDRNFFGAVANQCALALERARLLEDEQEARQQVEARKATLAELLERLPVPLCILRGDELVYELTNAAYRALPGDRNVLGRKLSEAFPEFARQGIPGILREVLRTGVGYTNPALPVPMWRDGALVTRVQDVRCERVAGSGGALDAVLVATLDVTDAVAAHRELDFARRRWEQTVAQMPSGLVLIDAASQRPAFANEQAVHIWSGDSLKRPAVGDGSKWRAFDLEGREVRPEEYPLARALRGETVRDCRMAFELPGVTQRLITRSNTAPLRDERGEIVAAVSVFEDVTADVEAEQERARMIETLREEAEFRERLVAILGHDLRDPLGAIMFGADRLLRQDLSEAELGKVARRILASGGRMKRMIGEILQHAQARQSGALPIVPAPADLRLLVREAIAELELVFPQRIIDFVGEGEGRGVWDPDRLFEVISNLAGNALQHGDPARPVEISLEGGIDEGAVLIVRNFGPPIPPDALPTLFEAYRRGAGGRRRSGSLGLGLYIARQIVVAHGGEIEARSTVDDGTSFTVRLPRDPSPRA
ncbi:MAG: hypothetical protein NVSMB23_28430 [Myxococcales bacterium]